MKQIKKILFITLFLVGFTAVNAQTAHVDVREIMTKMPAMIDAQKQLEKLQKQYDTEFNTMVTEYRNKLEKYEREQTTVSDKMNEDRAIEVQDMEKRIQDYRQTAQKELNQKEQDLVAPIMDKAKAAIEKVGKAKGYKYVFDAASVLLADGPDITNDVKKELGF
jgi:outer membrane protein